MKLLDKLRRKSDEKREEKLTNELLKENSEDIEEEMESGIVASIVMYTPDSESNNNPTMTIFPDNFKGPIMPEPDSIIWIEDKETKVLNPYKVVRFDYVSNSSAYDSMRVYIVVTPARSTDIMPIPPYQI